MSIAGTSCALLRAHLPHPPSIQYALQLLFHAPLLLSLVVARQLPLRSVLLVALL